MHGIKTKSQPNLHCTCNIVPKRVTTNEWRGPSPRLGALATRLGRPHQCCSSSSERARWKEKSWSIVKSSLTLCSIIAFVSINTTQNLMLEIIARSNRHRQLCICEEKRKRKREIRPLLSQITNGLPQTRFIFHYQ